MAAKNSKRNNTTLFLLPLIKDVERGFNNSYLHDDKIVVTYRYMDNEYHTINKTIEEILPNFKEGFYSKFPNHIKQKILAFWGITSKEERLYQILYPNEYMYEAYNMFYKTKEIWPKPDMKLEEYKYQNYESNS